MGAALASPATLRLAGELKAEPYTDATTVQSLAVGVVVDVLERKGGWVRVKSGSLGGWLRASSLGESAAGVAADHPLLKLEGGRSGKGNLVATTGIRGFGKPASRQVHALIMAIGAYRNGIPNLSGVAYDVDTAREIAMRMGVPEANMHVLRDGALTLAGMGRAFDDLEASLADGDQVFVYYSGHGGRQKVSEADGAERCAESLVTVDGEGFLDSEMEKRLASLARKAQKVIVFLDACHSGGVTTRAVGGRAAYTPKYWVGKGSAETCAKPTNMVTRGLALATRAVGTGAGNFVHVAAARDDEISFDQPGKGGVASRAWLDCMAGAARDLDGSGGLSAEEIRVCAQERIEKQLGQSQTYLPHHVTITGNAGMVLSYALKEAPAAPAVEPPKSEVAKPQPVKPAPVADAAARVSPVATLNDIYNNRDDRRLVTLTTSRPRVRIGKEGVSFELASREGGYAYVLMVGSDGETFDLLYPNKLDPDNRIRPGETLRLPSAQWQLSAGGPEGRDTLLAIVSDGPRDFLKAGAKPSGPFSSVPLLGAKDIQLVSGVAAADGDECATAAVTRTLTVQKRCSGAYGAALLAIEEVLP